MRIVSILLCFIALLGSSGCVGGPGAGWGYDTKRSSPGNRLSLGGGRGIDLTEDTDITMTGVNLGRDGPFSNHFRADSIQLRQSKATWDGILAAIDRNNTARGLYYQHVNDVMERIPPIIQSVAPIVTDFINMQGNVAMQRALRPTLIQQLAGGLVGGRVGEDLLRAVFRPIDPTLADDVVKAAQPSNTSNATPAAESDGELIPQ